MGLCITRPKGRVRIETVSCAWLGADVGVASPGRKAGCGLKPDQGADPPRLRAGITRPKGRVRIETATPCSMHRSRSASPGRKAGCGLKPDLNGALLRLHQASPGRKAGCGLKHARVHAVAVLVAHHPAERPGAD